MGQTQRHKQYSLLKMKRKYAKRSTCFTKRQKKQTVPTNVYLLGLSNFLSMANLNINEGLHLKMIESYSAFTSVMSSGPGLSAKSRCRFSSQLSRSHTWVYWKPRSTDWTGVIRCGSCLIEMKTCTHTDLLQIRIASYSKHTVCSLHYL